MEDIAGGEIKAMPLRSLKDSKRSKGEVGISMDDGIVKVAGHDEDVSLGLGSAGKELMEETRIFKVVKDQQPRDLNLEQGSLDSAIDVMVCWQDVK